MISLENHGENQPQPARNTNKNHAMFLTYPQCPVIQKQITKILEYT
jgi:hypothetical protein